jgi:Cu(I)/Ag(I) efflux system protein CusF
MKYARTLALTLALSVSTLVLAQSEGMKGMDMKGMDDRPQTHESKMATHRMKAVVKAVDRVNGKVTLAHEPVKTLSWPAMTMKFSVKDKTLLDKLPAGQKVEAEFRQQGSDYVITGVK